MVASQLSGIEPQLAPLVATADPARRDAFAGDIEALRDTVFSLLGQEEDDILPVGWTVLSQREWVELDLQAPDEEEA